MNEIGMQCPSCIAIHVFNKIHRACGPIECCECQARRGTMCMLRMASARAGQCVEHGLVLLVLGGERHAEQLQTESSQSLRHTT